MSTPNCRYFHKMLSIFASPLFYSNHVHSPDDTYHVPNKIHNDSKLWPFFKDTIGTIDGSHIHAHPPSSDRPTYRNHKGFILQNCLFACDFNLKFSYALTGWEGSVIDARLYDEAWSGGLYIPPNKYFLADAGFPLCHQLLVPYHSVRYHLAEWRHANIRCILFPFYSKLSNITYMSVDQQTRKSCSICDMHLLEMWLSTSSAF